jgi:hypothetical protein
VWDLREGCILVRESKKGEDGKVVADPSAFTAVKVKHSGEEESFTMPTKPGPSEFLARAAAAFFGEKEADGTKVPEIPAPLVLAFDPSGARAAVSTKGGGNAGEPKKKPEFVKALVALPAYAGKEAELKKKNVGELKKLWEEAQQNTQGTPVANETPPAGDENATSDDEMES